MVVCSDRTKVKQNLNQKCQFWRHFSKLRQRQQQQQRLVLFSYRAGKTYRLFGIFKGFSAFFRF